MRIVIFVLLLCTAAVCIVADKTVPIKGWSVAGRHSPNVYKIMQKLRAEGYTHFAVPEATQIPWYIKGEIVASKQAIKSVKWDGFKVAKIKK